MTLFIAFPFLIKKGLGFYPSMGISIFMTILAYYSVIFVLDKVGLRNIN